ncbi:uncharacterized protein LOC113767696 [Coffea eugenioides]|uniref:Uncharacterized protein n=1 Tax=Coffea arabica TaxID=13443 RepID=A0A6P6X9S0_COFAR|nr:uncharacterized protein LOC113741208 [Coffea arabica]XP_027167675.1 uncharacterized protein LOC113767696 [Coffea eugenioides]
MALLSISTSLSSYAPTALPLLSSSGHSSSTSSTTSDQIVSRQPHVVSFLPRSVSIFRKCGGLGHSQQRRGLQVVRMAPEEEKMTRRSPLDFPIEWERPKPGRRPDIFPQFSPMKTPLPPPLPADPPEEDEEEEEEKKEEEEEDPEKEDDPEKQDQ